MCLHLFSFSCSQITKMTCGSLITFYDSQQEDATVAVDVCLTALIIAKVPIKLCQYLQNFGKSFRLKKRGPHVV